MPTQAWESDGAWEEIAARAPGLAGRRVRLIVPPETGPRLEQPSAFRPAVGPSTAESLLQHAGTWQGDDLRDCLKEVCTNRAPARF